MRLLTGPRLKSQGFTHPRYDDSVVLGAILNFYQFGSRFSKKAVMPSWASSDTRILASRAEESSSSFGLIG